MEPPNGVLASLLNFIRFLPFFIGLLLLGSIKGIILCPVVCLIVVVGNTSIILGLWPLHVFWTCYSILRAKHLGCVLKLVISMSLPFPLILWPVIGIVGSVVCGASYGFLSPIFATFDAVGEGKSNQLFHCFYDGTWTTIKGSCTVVRDFGDVCYHSYFSIMDELKRHDDLDGKFYEIRLLQLPGAIIAGLLGFLVDFPLVSLMAVCKSPYMLLKGWRRLFHDLIGREGPFLETICVPFAGLAILLWPLAVVGAVLGSVVSSIFLGSYAGVVAYQESSFWFGLCYVVASLAIYDEYSNDVLDMPEGSCIPRPKYRKNMETTKAPSRAQSFSRPSSFQNLPSRSTSLNNPLIDINPFEILSNLFRECRQYGEMFVCEGLITQEDIEEAKSNKGDGVISIGLPAYGLVRALIRSAKANSAGILLSGDGMGEITSTNRPKDAFFDWFLNPFLIIKDQIRAASLSDEEEDYLCKLVLLGANPMKLAASNIGRPPQPEIKRAELDALARRLRGLVKSISRYPTSKRNFESLVKNLSEELAKKKNGEEDHGNSSKQSQSATRLKGSYFSRALGQSFKNKTTHQYSLPAAEISVDVL